MINFYATLVYLLRTQPRATFYEKLLYYYQYNIDEKRFIDNFYSDGYGLISSCQPVEVKDKFGTVETISLAGMLKQSTKTIFEEGGTSSRNTHSQVVKTLSECGLIRVYKPTAQNFRSISVIEIIDDLEVLSDLRTEDEYLKTEVGREVMTNLEYAKQLELVQITDFRLMYVNPQKLYDKYISIVRKFNSETNPFDLKAQIKRFEYKKSPKIQRNMF